MILAAPGQEKIPMIKMTIHNPPEALGEIVKNTRRNTTSMRKNGSTRKTSVNLINTLSIHPPK
jgi:hypothetical protein